MRKPLLMLVLLSAQPLIAQKAPRGIWQGYDGEWGHVSQQLVALAEATPEEKFGWRPAPGVRSASGVYMHIAIANFYLLGVTGPAMPAELKQETEKSVTSKTEVITWLKRSLDAVKRAVGQGEYLLPAEQMQTRRSSSTCKHKITSQLRGRKAPASTVLS